MNYTFHSMETPDQAKMEKAVIAHDNWNYGYCPETLFYGAFLPNIGFSLQFACRETPLVRYRNPGDPVWNDSCMEFFANFDPERSDLYLNVELNAGGGILLGVGKGRENREPITSFHPYPTPEAVVEDGLWRVSLLLPLDLIESVYGKIDFKPGYTFRGNLYKCGDETPQEHYLSWNPISLPEPDFHCPKFFGTMTIG